MQIQPWLQLNIGNFWIFSQYPGTTSDGEIIQKPTKKKFEKIFSPWNRNIDNLPILIGDIWERILLTLLPPSTITTGKTSSHDFELVSWINQNRVLVELKTAQMRNRWVIRKSQIDRYMSASDNSLIYFAQLFYQMKSGDIPSMVPKEALESEFLPVCLYIFPISFVLYMVSSCQPCGNHPDTQFYAMTHYRAQTLYNLAEWGHAKDTDGTSYRAETFRAWNLIQNPDMPIRIVDHKKTPHILSHITPQSPSASSHPQDPLSP